MNNLKLTGHKSHFPKKTVLTAVLGLVIGGIMTNQADNFIANHVFSYQSPITIQSPVIIAGKPILTPLVVEKVVYASASAEPIAKK